MKHREEMERATGEHFNVFHILGVGHYEVSTHSPLLACFLDPNGSHGQGSRFLKCFIEVLKLDPSFDVNSATVATEVPIGPRTDTTGGRLDILVSEKKTGKQIAIENKIHAAEQANWVRRYRNGLRPDAHLIYLTLNGAEPEQMTDDDKGKVVCISYGTSIIEWLECCRKEAATIPSVRESLTQYIQLIQHLTHQNPNSRMNQEIVSAVIQSPQSYKAYRELRGAASAVTGTAVRQLAERLRPRFPTGFTNLAVPSGGGAKEDCFRFTTPFLQSRNLSAIISFDVANYGRCFYGFEFIDRAETVGDHPEKIVALTSAFSETFGDHKSNTIWPAWNYWMHYNWDDEVIRRILFEAPSFDDEVLELVTSLFKIAQDYERNAQ